MQFSLSKKVDCFKENISKYYLYYYFFNVLSKNNQFTKGGYSNIFGKLILASTS